MSDTTNESNRNDTNPYLAGAGGAAAVSSVPKEPDKKDHTALIIVVCLIVAVVAVAALIAFLFVKKGKNPKELVEEALQATFDESGDYLSDAWALEQYQGMFGEDTLSVTADMSFTGGVDGTLVFQRKEGVQGFRLDVESFGLNIGVQGYLDDSEIRIAIPDLLDYVFIIDRETLPEDIQHLVEMGVLDEETVEQLIALNAGEASIGVFSSEFEEEVNSRTLEAWDGFYEKAKVEKLKEEKELEVNGQARKCKGYQMVMTYSDIADFLETVIDLYLENPEFKAYLDSSLMAQGYGESEVEEGYRAMEEAIDEFLADFRADGEKTVNIDFYLYEGRIAQVSAEGDGAGFEWDVKGGNFPLENTVLTIGDGNEEIGFAREGSSEGGEHRAKYSISAEDEEYEFAVLYGRETGDFSFEVLAEGNSLMLFEGSLEKADDATLKLTVDTLELEGSSLMDGTVTVSDECGEIENPQGEEKNILLMDNDDWEAIVYELLYSLYVP